VKVANEQPMLYFRARSQIRTILHQNFWTDWNH